MAKIYKVKYSDDKVFEVEEGTKLIEIAKQVQDDFKYPIMVAKVDNDIVGLDYEIIKKCDVKFYDKTTSTGKDVYSNSIYMLMVYVIKKL